MNLQTRHRPALDFGPGGRTPASIDVPYDSNMTGESALEALTKCGWEPTSRFRPLVSLMDFGALKDLSGAPLVISPVAGIATKGFDDGALLTNMLRAAIEYRRWRVMPPALSVFFGLAFRTMSPHEREWIRFVVSGVIVDPQDGNSISLEPTLRYKGDDWMVVFKSLGEGKRYVDAEPIHLHDRRKWESDRLFGFLQKAGVS